jgi:TIGR03009 family protein
MRTATVLLLLATDLIGAAPAQGQGAVPSRQAGEAKAQPRDAKLEAVLRAWEEARGAVKEMHARFKMTRESRGWARKEVGHGEVRLRKPDLLRVDLADEQGRPDSIWLLTKEDIHHYTFKDKVHRVLPAPTERDRAAETRNKTGRGFAGLFSFRGALSISLQDYCWGVYGGMPPADFKDRYDLCLTNEGDEHWVYIEVRPRTARDRADFEKCQVVLDRKTFWVRRAWIEFSSGDTATWDFDRPDRAPVPHVTRESLTKELPKGWNRVETDYPVK